MALPSGATFAGYIVARRLGAGATGVVYLVQDPRSSTWQALKVLSPAAADDDEARRRFQDETPLATHLVHPNIVRVHDRGEFDGQLWVAMDYVDGISAAQLAADRFPAVSPVGEALAVVTALAEALDYAHQRGLVHRDVKPANIFLTGRGEGEQRILLSDFGIVGEPSPAYAAPEQLIGADVDGRADQYALAATAFHLLTGTPPAGAPPRLSDQRPELARLDAVFARALARRAADRFDSCRDFADAANEQAGLSAGERSPEAVLVADYPAYAWPEADDAYGGGPASAAARNTRGSPRSSAAWPGPPSAFSGAGAPPAPPGQAPRPAPKRRSVRKTVLRIAGVVALAGLLALGVVVARRTQPAPPRPVGSAAPAPPARAVAPSKPTPDTATPVPLDGTYRLEVQRTKQTYNYAADPQPPDVTTWWAFRSACTPDGCTAAATRLDDNGHTQQVYAGGAPMYLRYGDDRWQSSPTDIRFPCVGSDGAADDQTATLVLTLQPQPNGDFAGEEILTVQTNECDQRSAVIRIPAVASPQGAVPPGVTLPDPAAGPESGSTPSPAPTAAPRAPRPHP